jgi:hypothetical protein
MAFVVRSQEAKGYDHEDFATDAILQTDSTFRIIHKRYLHGEVGRQARDAEKCQLVG